MKAEIHNFSAWVNYSDERFLKYVLGDMLQMSKFEVLGFIEHTFNPFGYTAVWLLGSSHLAVHTFPEEGKAYIELSSCVRDKFDIFLRLWETLRFSSNTCDVRGYCEGP